MGKKVKRNERTETVGSLSSKLLLKEPDASNAIDQMYEQLTDYDENMQKCIKDNRNKYICDFYVVVLTKKERLMQNVIRSYFFARSTCPTPDYDQAVYRYHRNSESIEFMWVIPSADVVNFMKNNGSSVLVEQYELLQYVLNFCDGSLLALAKSLNNERKDSNILDN